MTTPVSYTATDRIGTIVIDSPPVNALSHAVRQGIIECLKVAEADDTEIVILRCEGRTFIAGADITEFGKPPQAPALATVLEALESHPKPVIAAIHGTALGGGLELALCCDYRLAVETAKVGLPEVNLGLLPGAGGTQRLPRLTGLKMAINMITSGRPLNASEAQVAGIADKVSSEDIVLVLESDKASMEIPAETGGTIKEVLVAVGDEIEIGQLLFKIEAEKTSQKKEAKIEPKKIYPQLIGDLLIVECIDLFNLGKSETSICLRCGYSIDNIGKFRRAFSKATKMPFGPLERMLREYKKSSEKIKDLFISRQIFRCGEF